MTVEENTGVDEVATASDAFPVSRVVDGFFLVGALATVVYWVSLTPGAWFYVDDWPIAHQVIGVKGIFVPYNGHLAATTLAAYRLLFEFFGFSTYLPWRILGACGIASVGVAIYLTSRRRIGSLLAALLGVLMLWPMGLNLWVSPVALYASLTAGILCAYALNMTESRRTNLAVFALLTLSLASSDAGVPVAFACLMFCACTRPSRRRWFAVIIPLAAWGIWWLTIGRGGGGLHASNTSNRIHSLWFNLKITFVSMAGGIELLALLLAVGAAARFIQLARRGWDDSANMLSWLAALGVWSIGLAWTRPDSTEYVFRYSFVSVGFLVLAFLPRRPLEAPIITSISTGRNWQAGSVGVAVLSAIIVVTAGIGPLRAWTQSFNVVGSQARSVSSVVNLGPAPVPDDLVLPWLFNSIKAGQAREVFRSYGGMPVTPEAKVKALVIRVRPAVNVSGISAAHCPITTFPTQFADGSLVFTSDAGSAMILARFRTTQWFPVALIKAHRSVRLVIPEHFGALMEWEIRPADAPIRVGSFSVGGVKCIGGAP